MGSLTLKSKTGVNNIPGEFILDDIWSSFYFVPSITVLTLQYSSSWPCFSEIKNKSTANVSIFPSHKIIKFFVEQKKNVLQECACFMSFSQ